MLDHKHPHINLSQSHYATMSLAFAPRAFRAISANKPLINGAISARRNVAAMAVSVRASGIPMYNCFRRRQGHFDAPLAVRGIRSCHQTHSGYAYAASAYACGSRQHDVRASNWHLMQGTLFCRQHSLTCA